MPIDNYKPNSRVSKIGEKKEELKKNPVLNTVNMSKNSSKRELVLRLERLQ